MASAALKAIDDISYWDCDGFRTVKNISDDQRDTLNEYLVERYRIAACLESLPFVVMECHGGPPDDPPFSVAGAIAIWRDANDFPFRPIVGDFCNWRRNRS